LGETQFTTRLGNVVVRWIAGDGPVRLSEIRVGAVDHGPLFNQPSPVSIMEVVGWLKRYFDYGDPLTEVPWELLDQSTWTAFQRGVYRAASEIPHGETRTYGWIARRIGQFGAMRAVGQALRHNRLPILIPCHRVVSTDSLGGFMGEKDPAHPQLQLKGALLALEEGYRQPLFPFLPQTVQVGACT